MNFKKMFSIVLVLLIAAALLCSCAAKSSASESTSFLDKLISALAPMLATLLIGIVGYTGSRIPLASDELTMGIRLITAALFCGLPIIGWVCTLFAMKKFSLTKEEMERIKAEIASKKAEQES